MSGVTKEWLALLIFLLCFVLFTIGEAIWLNRKGWAGFGKGLAFSLATNFFSFVIGFFVVFVILGVILAMAWDGSIEKIPAQNFTLWAALIFAGLFPLILLTLAKRLLLALFKMQGGKLAWLFSIVSSIFILLVPIALPALFLYIF
jgi:hypothetical protein